MRRVEFDRNGFLPHPLTEMTSGLHSFTVRVKNVLTLSKKKLIVVTRAVTNKYHRQNYDKVIRAK
jgi:hypothetical protein